MNTRVLFSAYQLALLLASIGFVVRQLVRRRRKLAVLEQILAPYRRGDYTAALAAVEASRTARDERQYRFFRGAFLSQLGRNQEAESELTQALQLARQDLLRQQRRGVNPIVLERKLKYVALTQVALGELYLSQGRSLDAEKCFQASLLDWPGHGGSHRGLAETCLLRRDPPTAALAWARLSVQEERAVVPRPVIRAGGPTLRALAHDVPNMNLGESLGTLAWALAVADKDRAEADTAISEAIQLTDQQAVTSSALVHLHSGYACAALGDSARAAELWQGAAAIDPQGRSGRAAQAALVSQPQPAV